MTPSVVYVVIVTYNGLQWTDRCLSSLRNSIHPVKTIIIDNGSTDGSLDIIRNKYPEVDLIATGKNLGFGKGNNVGMRKALDQGADFIFLLNQDAWIDHDTMEKLITASQRNPEFGIISPVHLQADHHHLDKQFSNYLVPSKCNFYYDLYSNELQEVYACAFVNAAGWMITRKCMEAVGLFEPLFHLYGEDDNYIQRMRHHRYLLGVVPGAKMVHDRAERKSKKNEEGKKIEIKTFLHLRMLDVNNGLFRNFYNSTKVFTRYGFNLKTIGLFLKVQSDFFLIASRLKKYRKKGFLLDNELRTS